MRLAQAQKLQLLQTISDAYEKGAISSTEEKSVYIPMARNIRDQLTQAVRFEDTVKGYAALQASETSVEDAISQVGEQISDAADAVTTSIDSEVGRAGKTIGDRLDHIASFSTAKSDIHGSVLGAEIKNTILTMAGQNNLGDALKTLLADCIPCDGRVTAGFEVNISGNFKDQIESDIVNRINYLKNMLSFTANKDVLDDICSLVNSLNFMCVPDLVRILSLLTFLLTKYTVKIGDVTSIMMGLVNALFQPILIDLRGLFDQYAQLVLGVIECVIDSMRYQAQKLNIKQTTLEVRELSEVTTEASIWISEVVAEGKDFLEEKVDMLDQQINAFFGDWFNKSYESAQFSAAKLRITRVLGLISALIQFKSLGNICDGKNFSAEELSVFVNTYISPSTKLKISVGDDGVIVSDGDIGPIGNIIENIVEIQTSIQASDEVSDAAKSALEAGTDISSIGDQVTIRFEDCLYGAEGASSEKVQKWISELTNA